VFAIRSRDRPPERRSFGRWPPEIDPGPLIRTLDVLIVIGAIALGGCATASTDAVPLDGAGAGAGAWLGSGRELALAPDASGVRLVVGLDRGASIDRTRVALTAIGGQIGVAVDGDQLLVRDLSIALAPVEIPAAITGTPFRLTDVRLRAASPARSQDAAWSGDDDGCVATAAIRLDLDWSLAIADEVWPLTRQHLAAIDLGLAIDREGDVVTLEAGAIAAGVRWRWSDLVTFSDVAITVGATSAARGPPAPP
jgi:hypothetical protein